MLAAHRVDIVLFVPREKPRSTTVPDRRPQVSRNNTMNHAEFEAVVATLKPRHN
jgi:hypothetical protein